MFELFLKNPNEMELRQVNSPPTPKNDEVKIKLAYGGICGSDLSVYRGKLSHASYPLRPGHELVGTVIEAAKDAKYKAGTRVVVLPNTYCGHCKNCLQGNTNICPEKKSLGINTDGGFSEEFLISCKYVLPLPDDLPDEKAVLIEPLAVVVHAFEKVKITKDTSVVIVGSGNEGMIAAALAYHLGARVTAIDLNPRKYALIRSLGDIRAVHPNELINESFAVVIEAAGTKESVEHAIQLARPDGTIVLIGLAQDAILPVTHVVRNEISIRGSIIYNFPSDYFQAIEYLRDPKFNVNPIISKKLPLTEYKQAYEFALSGDYGKVIFKF